MYFIYNTAALLLGFCLDLLLGDPQNWWHPVCAIGKLISSSEKWMRKRLPDTAGGQLFGGVCLVLLVTVSVTAVTLLLVFGAYHIHWGLGLVLESILCYYIFAAKSLKTESSLVAQALEQQGLEAGRQAVSRIVGRDTQNLDQEGVVKAAVETVAENTSDGILAPMFYMALGGPVLGFFYKAVNTMDSMVGYKNEKYLYFGRCGARLDDVLNYIPSRLCAWLMLVMSALLPGFRGKNAFRIYFRDRRKHASPNSAQTEAVMAGALGVELAGDAWYFGERHHKPAIGDPLRLIQVKDISRANILLYGTAWLGMVLSLTIRVLIILL